MNLPTIRLLPCARFVAVSLVLLVAGRAWAGPPAVNEDATASNDLFADEPVRPKAEAPIRFLKSFDEARAEARRSGRRILAYFTGEFCGACRVLEKRTFTDAEVVDLSKRFVCVELDVVEHPRLADEFRIDSVPRSYILTSEGTSIDRVIGYMPAAGYAEWLEAGRTRPPVVAGEAARERPAPPAVGADASDADVVFWMVDSSDSRVERWGDPIWVKHAQLLQLLRAGGLKARVEHLSRADLPGWWDRAASEGRLPDVLASVRMAGLVREMERSGRLLSVLSTRLTSRPEDASCPDFRHQFLYLVPGSRHESAARRAIELLLRAGPETDLPGRPLPDVADRQGAESAARRAVVAFLTGDVAGLKDVASPRSPQLTRCTVPEPWLPKEVTLGEVTMRGNETIAFARVETTYRGDKVVGGDPFTVVLVREGARWGALSVGYSLSVLKALPYLCRLEFRPGADAEGPATPRLTGPPIDGTLDAKGPNLSWELPEAGGPVLAQVCEVLGDDVKAKAKGWSWPYYVEWTILPGEPRRGAVRPDSPEQTWCVWVIGRDGRVAISETQVSRHARPN